MENILNKEKSLYLARHAHNPVHWQPWSDKVFEMAKELNKPVFVSIGYSSCHWCRVMEKESFEDEETAKILNEKYIPVKVDKDEYPDVDKEYQFYIQSTGDSGGWPLSVFLTPDKEPFYTGTYFPKEKNNASPAFKTILESISNVFHNKYDEIEKVINTRKEFITSFNQVNAPLIPDDKVKEYRKNEFIKIFDTVYFGFREGAKFPYISSMMYLLDNFQEEEYASFLINTADKICTMGLCDHLFGGFFRYTVDRMWQMPHFEKMLSDNAQISSFLIQLYRKTGNRLYLYTAQKAIDFVMYDSLRTDYGYLDSLDADSPNNNGDYEEGYFYKVTDRDFTVLSEKELKNFSNEAGVHNGVIYLKHKEYIKAAALDVSLKKVSDRINTIKAHPEPDNKAVSGHNFMFCTTLLNMYEAENEPYELEQALALYHKLRHLVVYDSKVYRGLYAEEDEINKVMQANPDKENNTYLEEYIINHRILSDHVYYLEATLKFYEITTENEFLLIAKNIIKEIENTFVEDGIPYLDTEHRIKDSFDDDKPNPVGLYLYLINKYSLDLGIKADERLIDYAKDRAARFPTGHPTMIRALELINK